MEENFIEKELFMNSAPDLTVVLQWPVLWVTFINLITVNSEIKGIA